MSELCASACRARSWAQVLTWAYSPRRAGADAREVAEVLFEAAQAQADPSAGAALRSRVLAALARVYRHSTSAALDPRARGAADEAIELAEAAGDPAAFAVALLAAHDVAWQPGSAAERLRMATAMAEAARPARDADLAAALEHVGQQRGLLVGHLPGPGPGQHVQIRAGHPGPLHRRQRHRQGGPGRQLRQPVRQHLTIDHAFYSMWVQAQIQASPKHFLVSL